jgi:hypothetical protein
MFSNRNWSDIPLQNDGGIRRVMAPRDEEIDLEPDLPRGVLMQQTQIGSENIEQVARELGHRWGTRMRAQHQGQDEAPLSWPGSLQQARELVDAALGQRPADEERELLALLVEGGARRAWQSRSTSR